MREREGEREGPIEKERERKITEEKEEGKKERRERKEEEDGARLAWWPARDWAARVPAAR